MPIEDLIDLDFDATFDIGFDKTGDLRTVTGVRAAINAAVLRTGGEVRDFLGGQNTASRREKMRSDVETAIRDAGYLDFRRLEVTDVEENTVEFEVVVSVDESYEFSITA